MTQRCVVCQAQLPESVHFCTSCGSHMLAGSVSSVDKDVGGNRPASPRPAAAVSQPSYPAPAAAAAPAASSSGSSSSSSFSAPLPAARDLAPNTAKLAMDAHEFSDFKDSLSRGLMKDKDQLTKIKAAASSNHFTCAQAIAMSDCVKGHPGECVIVLYPSLTDADTNFESVLLNLKWQEERQEVIDALKLDASKYPNAFKKK